MPVHTTPRWRAPTVRVEAGMPVRSCLRAGSSAAQCRTAVAATDPVELGDELSPARLPRRRRGHPGQRKLQRTRAPPEVRPVLAAWLRRRVHDARWASCRSPASQTLRSWRSGDSRGLDGRARSGSGRRLGDGEAKVPDAGYPALVDVDRDRRQPTQPLMPLERQRPDDTLRHSATSREHSGTRLAHGVVT